MPRQFVNRGDRLVFSNGVLVLAIASSLMIAVFDADLTRLIQLYVIGVFTSFTLSQTGMVVHWRREGRRPDAARGWRRSIAINVVGATATGIVLVVVTVTKFAAGGWLSILFMGVLLCLFMAIQHHYSAVGRQLGRGTVDVGAVGVNHMVVVVRELDSAVAEALGAIRSIRPTELHLVHPVRDLDEDVPFEVQERWREFSGGAAPLEPLPLGTQTLLEALRGFVRGLDRAPDDFLNVVIPETVTGSLLGYVVRRAGLIRLKSGLLREPNVVVTDVPVVVRDGRPVGVDARPLIPSHTVAIVFVSGVHDATRRAVNYAMTLEASETRAVHFELDPERGSRIQEEWVGMRIPLDIVEAPFRDLTRPMLDEVRRSTSKPDTVAIVVVPEIIVPKWWQFPLHNKNALFVKRLFLFEPRVVLSSVPFVLGQDADRKERV
jgi:hypothetical protein